MLHVCHVVSGDLWAGAEVMTSHLLKKLSFCTGVRVTVILLNNGRLASELKSSGIETHIIKESQHSFFMLAAMVRSVISSDPPDVIHSHRYKENLLVYMATRFLGKSKLVSTQHGLPEAQGRELSLAGRLKSKANFQVLARRFHKIIAVSQSIGSFFVDELSFNHDSIKVIHNGIDFFERKTPKKSISSFVVGSSGRLFPVKDFPLMVEVAKLATQQENLSFVLAGDGPERCSVERTIQFHRLDDFFGLKGHLDDMDTFYSSLDVYINTSLHEGIPMTILEAMSHGLPIIAPRVGGIPEIIDDGVEGFLIEGRNPRDFAEKCLKLHRDRELWSKMSVAARNKVHTDFSCERMSKQYLQCYRDLVV